MAEALGSPLAEPDCMLAIMVAICSGSTWPIMSMAWFIISGLAWVGVRVVTRQASMTCFSSGVQGKTHRDKVHTGVMSYHSCRMEQVTVTEEQTCRAATAC